jgi:predicted kinase
MIWKFPKYCEDEHSFRWNELASMYPWISEMSGVKQDPRHHAEGDVAVHTDMVIKSLIGSDKFKELNEQDRQVIFVAALMHDIEKRSTTIEEADGSITSKNHSRKGEVTARKILYREIPSPLKIRESICKLVRNHGLPLWAHERDEPVRAVIGSSVVCNNRMLSVISESDVLGRVCADKEDLLLRIEIFREICETQGCYERPYVFPSDLSRFKYFNGSSSWATYEPFDDTKFEVILMSGLPGSGKDTYVNSKMHSIPEISLDSIRRELRIKPRDKSGNGTVVQAAKERAREYMRKKQSFVWNATNVTKQMRSQLIGLFAQYGARVKIVYVEVPYGKLLSQNKNREHAIPEAALEKMIDKLEPPDITEAHLVEYVTE